MLEILKAVILGIVEGITEFLPISSTGHLVLVDEFIKLNEPKKFIDMFNVVIQLGAIMAVVVLYFHKLNPLVTEKVPLGTVPNLDPVEKGDHRRDSFGDHRLTAQRLDGRPPHELAGGFDRPDRLRGLVHRNRKPQPKPTAPL